MDCAGGLGLIVDVLMVGWPLVLGFGAPGTAGRSVRGVARALDSAKARRRFAENRGRAFRRGAGGRGGPESQRRS
ncbi:hypothetical protein GCM10027258_80210 [Amycolatopsis stemonae]